MKIKRFMERPGVDTPRSSNRSSGGYGVRSGTGHTVMTKDGKTVGTSDYLPTTRVGDATVETESKRKYGPVGTGGGRLRNTLKKFGRT